MRRINSITIGLTVAFVLSMSLPETWETRMHLGQVPLGLLVLTALCLPLLWLLLAKTDSMSPGLIGSFSALVITAFWGLLRGNVGEYSLKFYVADLFCFLGFIAGYVIARTRRADSTLRLVSLVSVTCSIVVILTYVGVFAGLVTTIEAAGRTVTVSIFNACGLLIVLLPWATASSHFRHAKDSWRTWLLFGTALATAVVSATRSFLIEVALAACLYLIIRRKDLGTAFVFRLVCGIFAVGLFIMVGLPKLITFSFQRLDSTQITEESRYEELSLFWPQIRDDIWTGQGMGSRFVSNVVVDGNPLASAPHVGIVAFLMKGGVVMFLAYAVIPLYLAMSLLFSRRSTQHQRGAAASALMFIALACLSGGWSVLYMFAYGLALSSMTVRREMPLRTNADFNPVPQLPRPYYENSPGH